MIIQYQNKHFATWVLTPEGSWLECDDVKGSYSLFHEKCEVPPSEVHIVYWERRNSKATWEADLQLHHESTESPPFTNACSTSLRLCAVQGGVLSEMDLTDKPLMKSLDISCKVGTSISGLMNLSNHDHGTLNVVDCQADSEKRLQENGMRLGMYDAFENEHVPLLKTSYQRKQSPKITQHSETQSTKLLGQSNTTAKTDPKLEKRGTSLPSLLQVTELSQVEKQRFSENSFIIPVGLESNVACEGEQILNTTVQITCTTVKPESANIVVNGTASDSPAIPSPKKEFASNWIKSLIGRHPILPTSLSVLTKTVKTNSKCNVRANSNAKRKFSNTSSPTQPEARLSLRKACNYGGFIPRSKSSDVKTVSSSGCDGVFSFPKFNSLPNKNTVENNFASVASPSACTFGDCKFTHDKEQSPAVNGTMKRELVFDGHQKHLSKLDCSREHKIHRFRSKLLRKLKAKKNQLASLDNLANTNGSSLNTPLSSTSECGAQSKPESLQDLLTALQEQINSAENESFFDGSSNNSLCSSPGDTDFLEELLSPSTLPSLEIRQYGEDGSKLLEMLVDKDNETTLPIQLSNSSPYTVNPINGHKDYSLLENLSSVSNNSKVTGLNTSCTNIGSSMEKGFFEDMISCTFNSVGVDTDVCHFEDYF